MNISKDDPQILQARETDLGGLRILRALPRRQRRMVGAWCFLDQYGPLRFTTEKPMDVAPHPHIGLQTVSWLTEGEIIHHDSLGYEALIHPGQLNLMTAGFGIAHSEETPKHNTGHLSGVQLWVALPEKQRDISPMFDHYADLPVVDGPAGKVTVIVGTMLNATSPARVFTPLIGAEIAIHGTGVLILPLDARFEHALFVLEGDIRLNGAPVDRVALVYLKPGRHQVEVSGSVGARVLLIGGEPFAEPIQMWWNFIAGNQDEIMRAREAWVLHERFGEVRAYNGPRLEAPDLKVFAPANPAS